MPENNRERITAFMATMPSRRSFLQPVLESLQHQVDHLYVYCNYPPDIAIPDILHADWITIHDSRDSGDLGCTGRFHFVEQQRHGYIFLVDDDIIYSHDYVAAMIHGIERYGRKAVLSCHGGILPSRVTDFTNQRQLYDFEQTIPTDRVVNIIGLGVSAFHSTTLSVSIYDFPSINRDDLWFAIKCQKEQIPLVVIGRKTKLCKGLYDDFSLWKTEHRDRSFSLKQTQIAQTIVWKIVLPAIGRGVSILISEADGNVEPLKSTLRSISALSLSSPVELVVSTRFSSASSSATLERALQPLRALFKVRLIRAPSKGSVSACMRAGFNECKFDLVTMLTAGTRLEPDCITHQQRYILDQPRYCLIECTPDGRPVTDLKHSSAPTYLCQRHVVQATNALPESGNGWDKAVAALIERLVEHELPVISSRAAAQGPPGDGGPETAGAYSVFGPLARTRPIRFVRT